MPMGAWGWLGLAIVCEIGWATGLKLSAGFTNLGATAATVVLMVLTYICLAFALRDLPLGTAYAMWTGSGAVGVAIIGIVFFAEPLTAVRVFSVLLIVTGIAGLKFSLT